MRATTIPRSFWTYVAALQRAQPAVGARALSLPQSPEPPPADAVLATLINEVGDSAHDLVLVLDDYHVIEARPIHEGVAFLLDHLPPRLHLVIASRADPPLPLSRDLGRGRPRHDRVRCARSAGE